MLLEQSLRRDPVRQPEPDEERPFTVRFHALQCRQRGVASPLVRRAAGLDALLWPVERRDARALQRNEDTGELMVLQVLDPADELRIPDREAEPPAGHAVRLR